MNRQKEMKVPNIGPTQIVNIRMNEQELTALTKAMNATGFSQRSTFIKCLLRKYLIGKGFIEEIQ